MSTLKVNNIQNASGTDAISIGSDGSLSYPNIGRRNLIINGAMQVAQRGTSSTGVTSVGFYTADRFKLGISNLGTWTVDQSADAPSGFSNSLKVTATTADASPAAGDVFYYYYNIESQDLQHLAYGTSSAKPMTLSFWVKSNVTGTATVSMLQTDNANKVISPTYTINSADTWEYKTVSIPADVAGNIDNDVNTGFAIYWFINSGTDYSSGTNQTSWSTYSATHRNASNLGVGGSTSDYFAITGVQLEVGSVATPFEARSYGEELALCQRYYYRIEMTDGTKHMSDFGVADSTNNFYACGKLPNNFRARPTAIETTGTASDYAANEQGIANQNLSSVPIFNIYTSERYWTANCGTSSLTVGRMYKLRSNSAGTFLAWSVEL